MRVIDGLIRVGIEVAPAVLLAVMGGIVRMVQNPKNFSWAWFFGGILMSAFVGILIFLLIAETDAISQNFRAAICGISGYSSAQILSLLERRVLKNISKKGV